MDRDTVRSIVEDRYTPFTTAEAREWGVSPYMLRKMEDEGVITRGYGVWMSLLNYHTEGSLVTYRYPYAAMCMISALCYWNMTTLFPRTIDVSIPVSARNRLRSRAPIRVYTEPDAAHGEGVVVCNPYVRVTCPERTVIDVWRRWHHKDEHVQEAIRAIRDMGYDRAMMEKLARVYNVPDIMDVL